jgi:hypothetical protein
MADGSVRTVELGQFEDANAMLIADGLDAAGIVWWHKTPGRFTRILSAGDWGVRLYVDAARADEARQIAADVLDT